MVHRYNMSSHLSRLWFPLSIFYRDTFGEEDSFQASLSEELTDGPTLSYADTMSTCILSILHSFMCFDSSSRRNNLWVLDLYNTMSVLARARATSLIYHLPCHSLAHRMNIILLCVYMLRRLSNLISLACPNSELYYSILPSWYEMSVKLKLK